ncbi:translocon subunit SSS1 [Aspergillus fumigatus Af293]|uniref:Protein translocation complex subunit Sss1, putative n=2 Tax=Aspergillus fumigatus TaxID=746128 RepID=Q4WWS5_ASPFU|nr:protein translocation complex subunit Sss1, putative [Aspergillus fumigatus Af293]EAL92878.2 protein translocation complex subunit Sss1, putative [Aspergillus fumigatus Af293]EDP53044.1 protein translocation complex subunit Sss1, putative [Aspergillus fumigatus A1163]
MSDTIQELADIPRDFLRDGMLFVRRCTKPDKREFIKISQAVGMGFIIMVSSSSIGYFIKVLGSMRRPFLIVLFTIVHIPVNNILVGGA